MDKTSINKRFVECVNRILSDNKEINKSDISSLIGVKANTFSEILNLRMNVATDHIANLINAYPVFSTEWILTGKGQMLKTVIPPKSEIDAHNHDLISFFTNRIEDLSRQLGIKVKENDDLCLENMKLTTKIKDIEEDNWFKSDRRDPVHNYPDVAAEPGPEE